MVLVGTANFSSGGFRGQQTKRWSVSVSDSETRQTYYRSDNAKSYRIKYVLSIRTNDNLIATFNC